MKVKFPNLYKALGEIKTSRDAYKAARAEQEVWLDRYSKYKGDFATEIQHAKDKIAKLEDQERNAKQANIEKLLAANHELAVMAGERAKQPINYADPNLIGLLQAANLGTMSYERATSAAEQYRGNQNVLKLLQDTFAKKNIASGIDQLVYDPGQYEKAMSDQIYSAVWHDNHPAGAMQLLGKWAKLEGVDLPDVGDAGMMEAAYRGAGLPDPNVAKAVEAARQSAGLS